MARSAADIPRIPPGPSEMEMAAAVTHQDNELHLKALSELGVSDKMQETLRKLDALAPSSAVMLSISLEKTHRLYYILLVNLSEAAMDLKSKLTDPTLTYTAEERFFLNRNFTEMVKEVGRGYGLTMAGAEAIVRMLKGSEGSSGGRKAKPGWTAGGKLSDQRGARDAADAAAAKAVA